LLELTEERIAEVSWSGMNEPPPAEKAAELARAAARETAREENYGGTLWDMTLRLTDGETLSLLAGEAEDIISVSGEQGCAWFRAPELYQVLRTQNDREGKGIDREALERYRVAVDAYLAENAPENSAQAPVRLELLGFYQVQESGDLDAQVWCIGTAIAADPPERIVEAMGNGYVDSELRFHGIGSDWQNLLVTADGQALGLQSWSWLEAGGVGQYASLEELKGAVQTG